MQTFVVSQSRSKNYLCYRGRGTNKNSFSLHVTFTFLCDTIVTKQRVWIHWYRTWNNAQLGEVLIQQLEEQGLQMAQEKQNYFGMYRYIFLVSYRVYSCVFCPLPDFSKGRGLCRQDVRSNGRFINCFIKGSSGSSLFLFRGFEFCGPLRHRHVLKELGMPTNSPPPFFSFWHKHCLSGRAVFCHMVTSCQTSFSQVIILPAVPHSHWQWHHSHSASVPLTGCWLASLSVLIPIQTI